MAVKLRLMRMGKRNRAFFRINAVDSRTPRGGKILEKLGHYDPLEKDPARQIVLNHERVQHWLDKGAIPTDTISQILLKQGIKHKYAREKTVRLARARALARAKGKPFTKAEKIALQKQAEEKAKDKEAKKQQMPKAEPKKAKPPAATERQQDVQETPKAESETPAATEQQQGEKEQPMDESKK